ncbi:metalloregulator ArsR/SmtB family transcription factor [Reinekea forsetii]|nr:metalloregulator ArsR/SmtB family transcription factor [Reinekea forsetii]
MQKNTVLPKNDELDLVFKALADPTRRHFIEVLKQADATVGELAEPLAMSLPAASKHISVLTAAGLVSKTKVGRVYRCHFQPEAMLTANEWLEQNREAWNDRLDALSDFLESNTNEAT